MTERLTIFRLVEIYSSLKMNLLNRKLNLSQLAKVLANSLPVTKTSSVVFHTWIKIRLRLTSKLTALMMLRARLCSMFKQVMDSFNLALSKVVT